MWFLRRPSPPEPRPALPTDLRAELFVQQYVTVRAEMLASINAQHQIMTYAVAASAAVFTGVLAVWANVPLRVAVLALVPLLLIFLWLMWVGEVQRMARAARFIWEMEKLINSSPSGFAAPGTDSDLSGAAALHWETWIRGANRWSRSLHLSLSYLLASGVLMGMAGLSGLLAVTFAVIEPALETGLRLIAFGCVSVYVALFIGACVSLLRNPLLRTGAPDR